MRISSKAMFEQQMNMLSKQYNKVGNLFEQMTSGKKIQFASDDPVLASRIKMSEDQIRNLNNFKNNQILAKNRSELFSNSVGNVVTQLKHVKELIEQLGNGTLSSDVRKSIGIEIQGIVSSLANIANTKDSNGEYIYSGYNSNTPAFAKVNGEYQYQGGYQSGTISISPDSQVQYSESGYNVFGNMKDGNGSFKVASGPAVNTGTAYTSPGSVSDAAAYIEDTYTIQFVTNANGKVGYQVTGAVTGQVVPPPPAVLPNDAPESTPSSDIVFNGISLHVSGQPNNGDQFTLSPSNRQNLFQLLSNLANAVSESSDSASGNAIFQQILSQSGQAFELAYQHLVAFQSELGSRENFVSNASLNNDSAINQQIQIWSTLSDTDMAQVVSEFKQNKECLELSLETYIQIQQLFEHLLTGNH